MRHTGQVVDQSFLKEEPDDIVHAIVLGLGCCCAIETGRGGTRFHDGADDAHHCLKPMEKKMREYEYGFVQIPIKY